MKSARWTLGSLSVLLLLAACGGGGGRCPSDAPYRFSPDEPPLRVPEGLDNPESDAALRIPPVADSQQPRPPGVPVCLEHPPSYYPDRPRPDV